MSFVSNNNEIPVYRDDAGRLFLAQYEALTNRLRGQSVDARARSFKSSGEGIADVVCVLDALLQDGDSETSLAIAVPPSSTRRSFAQWACWCSSPRVVEFRPLAGRPQRKNAQGKPLDVQAEARRVTLESRSSQYATPAPVTSLQDVELLVLMDDVSTSGATFDCYGRILRERYDFAGKLVKFCVGVKAEAFEVDRVVTVAPRDLENATAHMLLGQSSIAAAFNVVTETIRNWKKLKAPIDDLWCANGEKLAAWVESRGAYHRGRSYAGGRR